MRKTESINIKVGTVRDIFADPEPDLSLGLLRSESGLSELETALAGQYPHFTIKQVTFEVAENLADDEKNIIYKIRTYCQNKADSFTQQSRNTKRWGWQILPYALLGVAILSAVYLATVKFQDAAPALAGLTTGFLTVAAWVIVWQPLELLLYDWRELKRKADIYVYIASLNINLKTAN